MSTIQKMSIQGIRSFGPDDTDKQVIQFFSPLTLILGPNGTGKTTIIECLKYMTTGEMPPGSRTNGAFVHDPKIAHEREVKAQIRLQFKDVRQQQVLAIRSLIATQKPKKIEMKTLEGTINRMNQHGEKTSVSSRCAEMDREMVTLLGVSKPVLDYVIFCHQEESNWPLSEGKALKQKFDDIFASTRYVKALEVIRKTKQEHDGNIKMMKTELQYLKQNKEKAAEVKEELEETQSKYLASKESVDSIEDKIRPIEEQQAHIQKRGGEFYQLESKIKMMKAQKQEMQKSVEEIRDKLENEFQGDTSELQRMLRDFERKVKERQTSLSDLQNKLDELEKEALGLGREKSRLLVTQGKLQQEAETHKGTVQKRGKEIKKAAEVFDISGFSGEITEFAAERFLSELKSKTEAIEDRHQEIKTDFEDQDSVIQAEMDAKRGSKTKLETEKKMKMDQVKTNVQEVRNLNQRLSDVEASAGKLDNVDSNLKRAEHELKNVESAVDLSSLKAEVEALQAEKKDYDAKLRTLDVEMSRISRESTIRSELDVHKKESTSKEDQIRRLKSKNEDNMKKLLGKVPEDNYRRLLENYVSSQSKVVRTNSKALEGLKYKLTGMEINKKNQMEQLAKKRDQQRDYSAKIYKVCESRNLEERLEETQGEMDGLQSKIGYYNGSSAVFTKYKSALQERSDPPCPLCHRPFDNENEVEELVESLEHKINIIPEKVEQCTEKMEVAKKKYEDALQLGPIKNALEEIESQEIPNFETKISNLTDQINKIKEEIAVKEEEFEVEQGYESSAKSMLPDMTIMDRMGSELREVTRKIRALSSKLSGDGDGKTLQEITQEREDIQLQLDTLNRNLERKRDKQTNHLEQVQDLKAQVNELGREKLQIESDLQQRSQMEKTKEELLEQNEVLKAEIEEYSVQLSPLETEIENLAKKKKVPTATLR